MGLQFKEYDPDQILLMSPELRQWLPKDHLVYFVSDVVDSLNLNTIYEKYSSSRRGQPGYHPRLLVKALVYGYCTGVTSSRRIEKATFEDVAFRVLTCGQHPDHDTIAGFRKDHLKALEGLFVQVLDLCQEAGLVKLGHVAIDGSKMKANASKHKAMSYERMVEKEKLLKAQVKALLAEAERVDEEEDRRYGKGKRGDELPEELRFRESRLKKIQEAKQALEEQARQKAEQEKAQAKAGETKRKKEGDAEDLPKPKAQRNFTDPESRIMKDGATKSFVQGYNAQIAVDQEAQVIVACDVTQAPNDKQQAEPMVDKIEANVKMLPLELSVDSGYFSEEVVTKVEARGIELFCPPNRMKHDEMIQAGVVGEGVETKAVKDRMHEKLNTPMGKYTYGKRKETVEPVFGQIKQARGIRGFLMRGLDNVRAEWSFICTTHNVLKLYRNFMKNLSVLRAMTAGWNEKNRILAIAPG